MKTPSTPKVVKLVGRQAPPENNGLGALHASAIKHPQDAQYIVARVVPHKTETVSATGAQVPHLLVTHVEAMIGADADTAARLLDDAFRRRNGEQVGDRLDVFGDDQDVLANRAARRATEPAAEPAEQAPW